MVGLGKKWRICFLVIVVVVFVTLLLGFVAFSIFQVKEKVWFTATLWIEKEEYWVDEEIIVIPQLINVGTETVTIIHGYPLFQVKVYDVNDALVLTYPTVILDTAIERQMKPNKPYYDVLIPHKFILENEGTYKIVASAEFKVKGEKEHRTVYTEHVWITIKPFTIEPVKDTRVGLE